MSLEGIGRGRVFVEGCRGVEEFWSEVSVSAGLK